MEGTNLSKDKNKKKLLVISDASNITSGLARCAREVLKRAQDDFIVAQGGWHHDAFPHPYPYFIYPLPKGSRHEQNVFREIMFSFYPDIVLCIGDSWNFDVYGLIFDEYKRKKSSFKSLLWVTVDGDLTDTNFANQFYQFDLISSFSKFGAKEIKRVAEITDCPVVYPGVDTEVFYPFPEDKPWDAKSVVDIKNTFTIGTLNQHTERKYIPGVIESYKLFAEGKDDTVLWLSTNPQDAAGPWDLWKIIRYLGLNKNPKKPDVMINRGCNSFNGLSDSKVNVYWNGLKAHLSMSRGDGFGLSNLEAQATHTVPIDLDFGPSREVIGDRGRLAKVAQEVFGEFGIRRAIGSCQDAARHLEELYQDWKSGAKLIKDYNIRGRAFAESMSWDKTYEGLKTLIDKSLDQPDFRWVKMKKKVEKPKVLMVCPSFSLKCGIADYTASLVTELEKQGSVVNVFPSSDLALLKEAVIEKEYNICHIQFEYALFPTSKTSEFVDLFKFLKSKNIKSVVTLHFVCDDSQYYQSFVGYCDEVIVHAEKFKEAIAENAKAQNINTILLGCNELSKIDPNKIEIRKRELGLENGSPIIGSLGFLREQKNYKELVEAVRQLKDTKPDAKLFIHAPVHEFGSDVYDEQFYRFVESQGMKDSVVICRDFLSNEDLILTLSCVDMFVFPYFPMSEGASCSAAVKTAGLVSKPIIASDINMFADLNDGELFKVIDVSANGVYQAIVKVLGDEALQKDIVSNMNSFITKNSWESSAKAHIACYRGEEQAPWRDVKVGIGAPTYNDYERITRFFDSVTAHTDREKYNFSFLALDDGTQDKEKVAKLEEELDKCGIPLIKHEKNEGIPKSWNDLIAGLDCEIAIIFNDDIKINSDDWLESLLWFYHHNEKVGMVGWPLNQIDPETGKPNERYSLPDLDKTVERTGHAPGCCFAISKDLWAKVKQPEQNEPGFWNRLISFSEECDFGYELCKKGYPSYVLNSIAMDHLGSITFAKNPELATREFDPYLPKEEYLAMLEKIASEGVIYGISLDEHKKLAEEGKAFRMDMSRLMTSKKWSVMDSWTDEQLMKRWKTDDKGGNYVRAIHEMVMKDIKPTKVRWLDKDGCPCEKLI